MRNEIIECDRCAQHPLDPRRVETVDVSPVFAQRIATDATKVAPVTAKIDLCPKCQEDFVQFMGERGGCFVPGTRVVR